MDMIIERLSYHFAKKHFVFRQAFFYTYARKKTNFTLSIFIAKVSIAWLSSRTSFSLSTNPKKEVLPANDIHARTLSTRRKFKIYTSTKDKLCSPLGSDSFFQPSIESAFTNHHIWWRTQTLVAMSARGGHAESPNYKFRTYSRAGGCVNSHKHHERSIETKSIQIRYMHAAAHFHSACAGLTVMWWEASLVSRCNH